MRRLRKTLLILAFGAALTVFCCEYLIYYAVIAQCSWPVLDEPHREANILKALVITDTHVLGPRAHWLDKWRREWQMHQAFQTIISLHDPEVVFVLGDLFDDAEWSDDVLFKKLVERFNILFAVPSHIKMHVVPGNHDVGFNNNARGRARFYEAFNISSVQFLTYKGSHFVLGNSMAMQSEADLETKDKIDVISAGGFPTSFGLCLETFFKESDRVSGRSSLPLKKVSKQRPKLVGKPPATPVHHFPLYRLSDESCTEPDAAPLPERNKRFRPRIDALSEQATFDLINKLSPRVVFGGHTHHGCVLYHRHMDFERDFDEYTVSSFSWRNRPDPRYMLVKFTPRAYAITKCGLPREITIVFTALIVISITIFYVLKRG